MITVDETVTGTKRRPKVGPQGRLQPYFCGHTLHVSEWHLHDCPKKREALAERRCANPECPKDFKPLRAGQKYHNRHCMRKAMKGRNMGRANKAQAARKGLTQEQIQAMEVQPLVGRDAEIARKAAAYQPIMGEALVNATLRLMRASP